MNEITRALCFIVVGFFVAHCTACSPKEPDPCIDGYEDLDDMARYQCAMKNHMIGSLHTNAYMALAELLNEPGSLEVDKTKLRYNPGDDFYHVVMTFRAKNGFGAYRQAVASAKCDLRTGEVIGDAYILGD